MKCTWRNALHSTYSGGMEISAIFIYILIVGKCLTTNLLKHLCGSVQQCLFYTLGLKIASDLAFLRYSNGGTLGIGRFVFIGCTLQLELALKSNICHSDKHVFKRSRYSIVCVVTRLRAARLGVRIPAGVKNSLVRNVPTVSRAHPASYSMGIGVLYCGLSERGVRLIAHLHLVSLCDSVVC